jgi:hypothetical protein
MAGCSTPSHQRYLFHFSVLQMALKGMRLDNNTMIKINHGTYSNTACHEVL